MCERLRRCGAPARRVNREFDPPEGCVVNDDELAYARLEYERVRDEYGAFAGALRVLVEELCRAGDLPVDGITARVKDTTSLVSKLENNGDYTSLDDITDKCGVRVVTKYRAGIQEVLTMLREEFDVTEDVHHGATSPETFGYTSDHLLVKVSAPRIALKEWRRFDGFIAEVQVRSILQHAWATISHSLDYKNRVEVPDSARRRLFRVAALLETSDESFDQYWTEVSEIRADYRSDVDAEQWRHLPIDLDSLWAAWGKLDVSGAVDAALSAGFVEQPGVDQLNPPPVYRTAELPPLVRVTVAAGLVNVGEVAEVFARVPRSVAVLKRMVRRCLDEGDEVPFAVATDIPIFLLIAEHPSNADLQEAARPIKRRLIEAAAAAGLKS